MTFANQPICSRCWHERNPDRVPVRLMEGDDYEATIEQCAWCGDETVDGIWVRADPRKLMYPKEEA